MVSSSVPRDACGLFAAKKERDPRVCVPHFWRVVGYCCVRMSVPVPARFFRRSLFASVLCTRGVNVDSRSIDWISVRVCSKFLNRNRVGMENYLKMKDTRVLWIEPCFTRCYIINSLHYTLVMWITIDLREESLIRRAIFISFLQNEGYFLFITAYSSFKENWKSFKISYFHIFENRQYFFYLNNTKRMQKIWKTKR